MPFRAPIGISDFRQLRESEAAYVDKTRFIADVLTSSAVALLFPRPRRFGKTLNLSALRYFVERSSTDLSSLFSDLAVWRSDEARSHFQRYPVIFLTFKDVKRQTWIECDAGIRGLLADEFLRHQSTVEPVLKPVERERYDRIVRQEADASELRSALRRLSEYLARATGERVVILVDEYDTPIHAGYSNQYYDDVVSFFRDFLSGGLKDNSHLFKGVLTGILRVARESLFSGLNNLVVHSILSTEFATAFGFTEDEVQAIAVSQGLDERMPEIRHHYNGYLFGGRVIYNPWSVLHYFTNPTAGFRPYWVATSSDDLLRSLLLQGIADVETDLEILLRGGEIEKAIVESIALRDLGIQTDALWSLLLFSGYLKVTAMRFDEHHLTRCRLAIPNREVSITYVTIFRNWLSASLPGRRLDELIRALLQGDDAAFERLLEELIVKSLSFHDLGGTQPERVYQAFILGLLVHLSPEYEVKSNGESGFGRYDVMVLPREAGKPGVVLELKVLDTRRNETVEHALESALRQIRTRDYAAELRRRGATPIHEMGAVFDGKRAWVRLGGG